MTGVSKKTISKIIIYHTDSFRCCSFKFRKKQRKSQVTKPGDTQKKYGGRVLPDVIDKRPLYWALNNMMRKLPHDNFCSKMILVS